MLHILFTIPLVGGIVKRTSRLSAISELDMDALEVVLSQAKERDALLAELRRVLETKSTKFGNDKKELVRIMFTRVEDDHTKGLTQKGFQILTRKLHLYFRYVKAPHSN